MRLTSVLLIVCALAAGCWMRNTATLADPKVRATIVRGLAALNERNYAAAADSFRRAAREDSLDRWARYCLGTTYWRMMREAPLSDLEGRRALAAEASAQFEAVAAMTPRDPTENLRLDPRTQITNVWGSLAALYGLWVENEDSAVWAFRCGRERGGYTPAVLEYYRNMLASCDSNAILVTHGSMAPFAPWYLQAVERFRTDVTVTDPDLIHLQVLPERCCFGLYPLPRALSAAELDSLKPEPLTRRLLSLPVTGDAENPAEKIVWMLQPSTEDTVWTVGQQILYAMLRTNGWQRPVYFGVLDRDRDLIGLRGWTTNEGLVLRLKSHAADSISLVRMSRNAFEVFTYDHLWDEDAAASPAMQWLRNSYADHLLLLMAGCTANGRTAEAERARDLLKAKKLVAVRTVYVREPGNEERLPMREERPRWDHRQ